MSEMQKMTAGSYIRHRKKGLVLRKITPEQIQMTLDSATQMYQKLARKSIEILTHATLGDELNDCTSALGEMAMLHQLRQRGHFATEHDMVMAVERLKAEADDFLLRFLSQSSFITDETRPPLTHDSMTHELFPE